MKIVRVALGVLGGALLMASSAMATDFAAPVPPPPSVWGFYFGGGGCYDSASSKITFNDSYTDEHWGSVNTDPRNISDYNGSSYPTVNARGWCGTVVAGYDYQVGQNFVLGIFGDVDFQNKSGEFRHEVDPPYVGGNTFTGQIWNAGLGTSVTLGVRGGVLVTPDVLLYGLAGWSWSKATLGYFEGCQPNDCGNLSYSQTKQVNGPTVGVGVEAVLAQHVSGRVEYRVTNFGSLTSFGAGNGFSGTTIASVVDQSVRVVLVFRP